MISCLARLHAAARRVPAGRLRRWRLPARAPRAQQRRHTFRPSARGGRGGADAGPGRPFPLATRRSASASAQPARSPRARTG
eukprot:scaffold7462_cov430-Prasinococcus_capsulatus_cf.AAC.1